MNEMQAAETVRRAVEEARAVWFRAPPHIRVMAGAYVAPILVAMGTVPQALEALAKRVNEIEEKQNG